MPLVRVSNGGSKPVHIDLQFAAYYNNNSWITFNNAGYTIATLYCNGSGTSDYWRLLLYGDNTLIATAYRTRDAVTVDVSQYQTLKVTVPENGNTFRGWLELS